MDFYKFLVEEYTHDFDEYEKRYYDAYNHHKHTGAMSPELNKKVDEIKDHITAKYKNRTDFKSAHNELNDALEKYHKKYVDSNLGFHARMMWHVQALQRDLHDREKPPVVSNEPETYHGGHGAPDRTNGSPLHNVSLNGDYPEDIYEHGTKHYGNNTPDDFESMGIINRVRNRPNRMVKIYRAVPNNLTAKDRAAIIAKKMKYMMDWHKLPKDVDQNKSWDTHYRELQDEHDHELINADPKEKPIKINPGDWVTGSKRYAMEHGRDNLRGQFKIISKTVPAKHLFTDGNSLSEWGYDPSEEK